MKKQFVTYEIALALKGLGFDEECFGCYINDVSEPMNRYQFILGSTYSYSTTNHDNELDYIMAPLWQQVIYWLDKTHNCRIFATNEDWSLFYKDQSQYYVPSLNTNIYEKWECGILKALELIKQAEQWKEK